jgi:hypothetical protein
VSLTDRPNSLILWHSVFGVETKKIRCKNETCLPYSRNISKRIYQIQFGDLLYPSSHEQEHVSRMTGSLDPRSHELEYVYRIIGRLDPNSREQEHGQRMNGSSDLRSHEQDYAYRMSGRLDRNNLET